MTYTEFVKRVVTIFAIAILCVVLWRVRQILMLAFLSSIIAISLTIPVGRLQKLGLRRTPSILLTLAAALVVIVLFFAWFLPVTAVQMADLVDQFPDAFEDARAAYTDWYNRQDDTLRAVLLNPDGRDLDRFLNEAAEIGASAAATLGNAVASVAGNLAIVIIVAVFLLLEPKDYARGAISLIPPAYRPRALEVMVQLRITVTTWMTALTFSISISMFLVWLVIGIILGVPNGLALGVIAGFSTIIPNIGSLIPLVPITIFTLADEPRKLPFVLPAYLAIQLLESNVLTPSIVKRQLSIPAALVLLFQLIAATLFGFFGVLLAVPLLAITITLVRELYIHDILGLRGVSVDIETREDGALRLVTHDADGTETDIIAAPAALPPEDTPGWF